MSYLVYARKWRPQDFEEVVGQEHVITILKNALKLNRVAHAYIFSGPRGTGKTTTARILAMALNCQKGQNPKPCGECSSCQEIREGRSLDVIEIDGASNRGIEEIRRLRENVRFAPAKARYKIYIIDEMHQITADAFNALLKTLEEPPEHVKFIFATTHLNKVIPTILSRCQRFDFHRIALDLIVEKLKKIVSEEKLKIADEAISTIAKSADGSLRDAESILDQLVSLKGGPISAKDVEATLGLIEEEVFARLTDALLEKNTLQAVSLLDEVINDGKDLQQFVQAFMNYVRSLLFCKIGEEPAKLLSLSKEQLKQCLQQSEKFSINDLLFIFYQLTHAQELMRYASIMRLPLEMALVKLTQKESLLSLEDLISRLEKLEAKEIPLPEKETSERLEPLPKAQQETQAPQGEAAYSLAQEKEGMVSFEKLQSLWSELIRVIKSQKMSTGSYLEEGQPENLKGELVTIAFPKTSAFHKEYLESKSNKDLIEKEYTKLAKKSLRVNFILKEGMKIPKPQAAQEAQPEKSSESADPLIREALDMFGGKIVRQE